MTPTAAPVPARTSPLAHLRRAFSWNLGRVVPSTQESAALLAGGVADPVVQRYAAWRRSALLVALVPALAAFVLALLDRLDAGFEEFAPLGVALQTAWVAATAAVPLACLLALRAWTRPGRAARLLAFAWLVPFVLPFVMVLLPPALLFHLKEPETPATADLGVTAAAGAAAHEALSQVDASGKLEALREMTLAFVTDGLACLLLLPAVLSLIPGAMNGCLRIKSLLPAAQLPGWLLVCAAPAFLLFWIVILAVVNEATRSPLLEVGVLCWAGGPILYAIGFRTFVRPQLGDAEAARIARVKRAVGLVSLAGVALMVAFVATRTVAGLHLVGLDRERAMATRLEELSDDAEISLDDVKEAYAESSSFLYAWDLGSLRMVVDILAKFLLVTVVFAHTVLRATLLAWENDKVLRAREGASAFDASAAAALGALGGGRPA